MLIRSRIVDLLKQLFWRQNRYARNNSQYSYVSNKTSESREKLRENDKTTASSSSLASSSEKGEANPTSTEQVSPKTHLVF